MRIYPLPDPVSKVETVILANGEFPLHEIPISMLRNNEYIVCCDGAINKLSQTDIIPQAIVGDCDSLSLENRLKYKGIIHQIKEQDTNDLTKSVRFCLENGKKQIVILGATGKREDHTIANISLLADYIDWVEDISIVTDYGVFNAISSFSTFESYPGQQVSLFSIDPLPVSSHNLIYPVENRIFTNWWQATLNEAGSDTFGIDTEGKLIVFRAFS